MPPTLLTRLVTLLALLAGGVSAQLVEHGPWTGKLGPHSAEVRMFLNHDRLASLEVSKTRDFSRFETYAQRARGAGEPQGLAVFRLLNLEPDTSYFCRVKAGRVRELSSIGTFKTLPVRGTPTSFKFAFASNHGTDSEAGAFSEIRYQEPRLFIHLGNAVTAGDAPDTMVEWQQTYERFFRSFTQTELYRDVPLIYTWDANDYAGAPTHEAYRSFFPHYALPADSPEAIASGNLRPISQSLSVGRVRFVVLDTRTHRTAPDAENPTILGDWQWQWLQEELRASALSHPLIFLVSSIPWHVDRSVSGSDDHWGYYPAERTKIETWLADEGIGNVVILSGNAGLLAARVGSGEPGDPTEFQAGVIDGQTEPAIGHWTEGPLLPSPGEEFFGVVEVTDLRNRIDVVFRGMNQHGQERFKSSISVPAP